MGNNFSKINKILIFGNGNLSSKFLREIHEGDYVIGVDRAAYWLIQNGKIPDVAIGDFDSCTKEEYKIIQQSVKNIQKFPPEKNETDMELAIHYVDSLHAKEVLIFGATGTRLDHTVVALHLLENQIIIDEHNRIRLVGRGKIIIEKSTYSYLSILPYTKNITISLTGFKYNVTRKLLKKESSLGISNEIMGKQAEIEIFSGKAWVIESND